MVANPTLGVYVGFSRTLNTGAWSLGTSTLGTGTVLGDTYVTVYTDVAADVRKLSTTRGKNREMDAYQAGRCVIQLDNRARDYDPLNLSGPYVTGGVTDVKPGRLIYVTATDPTTGIVHRLFTGRIRNWRLDYTGGFDGVATIEASDTLTDLANTDVVMATTAVSIGAAAVEVLLEAGVTQFAYDDGVFTAQAMTWTTKALTALRTLELSEQAALYVETDGDVHFSSTAALVTEARSRVSQATFGSGNLLHESNAIDYDSDQVINIVSLTRLDGVEQSSSDQSSMDAYGHRSYTQTGLANASDTDVAAVADYIIGKFAEPLARIGGIEFAPRKHADLMTQALSRRIRDRVTVTFSPVGGGTISQELFITGIAHDITAQSGMRTSFSFESAEWSFGWILGTDALGAAQLALL